MLEGGVRYLALMWAKKYRPGGVRPHRLSGLPCRNSETADAESDFAAIGRVCSTNWKPGTIVIGYPVRIDGQAGNASRRMDRFARRLRGRLGRPVLGVDERYTSLEAAEWLAGRPARRSRFDEHALAAATILRRYLEEGDAVVLARW